MLASDAVGATGAGRPPRARDDRHVAAAMAAKLTTPFLMISGRPRQAGGAGSRARAVRGRRLVQKVFRRSRVLVAQREWERNHLLLFRASAEWLTQGTVNGMKSGMLKLGYDRRAATQ